MAEPLLVLGPSGTGKSYSLRNLPNDETYIINCVNKRLPFKGSSSKYSEENKNYMATLDTFKIKKVLQGISDKREDIKYIIIDDMQYIMADEFMKRSSEKGFEKWTELANHMYSIMRPSFIQDLRDDLKIIYLSHSEETREGTKAKTLGKLLDEKITIEGLFTIVLHTVVQEKGQETEYKFLTNSDNYHMAKSPPEMFDKYIDNDLKFVVDQMKQYYN